MLATLWIGLLAALGAGGPSSEGWKLTFETLREGSLAPEWVLESWGHEEGYRADIVSEGAHAGRYCLKLHYTGEGPPTQQGRLYMQVDAQPYRGKRVAVRAAMRAEVGTTARLFLRGDLGSTKSRLLAGHTARPVSDPEWRTYELAGEVGSDVKMLELSVTHRGRGTVLVDDLELAVLGEVPDLDALPPAQLEDRDAVNLMVLARLIGLLRFYHPSDQVAEADWAALARAAVIEMEGEDDPVEIARMLERRFAPVAPTVRLHVVKHNPGKESPWIHEPEGGDHVVVRWTHTGLATPDALELFASERERFPLDDTPRGCARPHRPKDFELGGAVVAIVPLALYADAEGTLPHAEHLEPLDVPTAYSARCRATRLAAVVLCWSTLQHFAPLLDDAPGPKHHWEEALQHALRDAARARTDEEQLTALRRMVAELYDGQARVDHVCDWRETHVPVAWDWIEEQLVVTNAHEEGDSHIGISVGDTVLGIGRQSAEEAFLAETQAFSGATTQLLRDRALDSMLRRYRGEPIQLTVGAEKGRRIPIQYRDAFARARVREERPEPYAELAPGVRYVDLSRTTERDLEPLYAALEDAEGVVFDLRDGPLRLDRRTLVSHFTERTLDDLEERIPRSLRPDREKLDWLELQRRIEPRLPLLDHDRVFLADGGVVGEAEALLVLVRDHRLGKIVGSPTGGTIGRVNAIELPGGFRVEWTATVCEPPKGKRVYGTGVEPHVRVERTLAGVRAGKDELLEAAVELLADSR